MNTTNPPSAPRPAMRNASDQWTDKERSAMSDGFRLYNLGGLNSIQQDEKGRIWLSILGDKPGDMPAMVALDLNDLQRLAIESVMKLRDAARKGA